MKLTGRIFKEFSPKAVISTVAGVFVASITTITLAATNQSNATFNDTSSANESSSIVSSVSSNVTSSLADSRDVISSNATSSDTTKNMSSSTRNGDNVSESINAIEQATNEGISRINSATNEALNKISSATSAANSADQMNSENSVASSSNTSSLSKTERQAILAKCPHYYDVPDPNNPNVTISCTDEKFQEALDTYNEFAKEQGVAQDAGMWSKEKYYCYKSEAILAWAKAHGWKIN
jgi:hypothetical protein